jgi:hypothetical protein
MLVLLYNGGEDEDEDNILGSVDELAEMLGVESNGLNIFMDLGEISISIVKIYDKYEIALMKDNEVYYDSESGYEDVKRFDLEDVEGEIQRLKDFYNVD